MNIVINIKLSCDYMILESIWDCFLAPFNALWPQQHVVKADGHRRDERCSEWLLSSLPPSEHTTFWFAHISNIVVSLGAQNEHLPASWPVLRRAGPENSAKTHQLVTLTDCKNRKKGRNELLENVFCSIFRALSSGIHLDIWGFHLRCVIFVRR